MNQLGGTQLNPTDPYEWTRALFDEVWEPTTEGAGEKTSGNTLAETSPRHPQPIPQQLIRQWVNYVAFCRWFITYKIDWREVFSFLDDTTDVAKGSSVCPSEQNSRVSVETPPAEQDAPSLGTASARGHGETSGSHSSDEVSASFNELRRVVTFKCTKLFGESPLYIHQQRLLRWTKMLVQCIVLRLRYASQGAKGENVCLISDEELRSYKPVFVRGRDVVGMASYIRPLGRLLEMRSDAVEGRSTLTTGDIQISTERGSNDATPDTTLSMNFSPGTPSQTLSPNITSLVVRSLEALWVDNLSVSWDVMDPDDIPKRVRTRLLGPMSSNESNYMDFSPIRGEPLKRPYSATFRPMFNNPVNCEGTRAMDVERIPIVVAIHLHQEKTLGLLKVVRLLEIAGYVMLTKARKLCEHKCYCILPFLDDYIALRNIVRDSLSVLSRSSASDPLRLTDPEPLQVNMLKITNILLFGLLALTKHLYEQCIRRLVSKHAGKASRTMLNFSVNSSAAEMGTEAQSASPMCIFVLETVVEPTLCILQLWVLSDDFHSSEGGGCGRFVLNILQTSINTVLGNASKMRMGSRAREQLQNDHNLLIRYIVSHPVYSRLQAVMRVVRPTWSGHGLLRRTGVVLTSRCPACGGCTSSELISTLERQIEPFVPRTFTALTQITRSVDEELMEKVSSMGGLRNVLVRCPKTFAVRKVGDVYVARRLREGSATLSDSSSAGRCCGLRGGVERRKELPQRPVVREIDKNMLKLIPDFFVPLDILVEKMSLKSLGKDAAEHKQPLERDSEKLFRDFIGNNNDCIDLVSLKMGDIGGGMTHSCFVRLRQWVAKQFEGEVVADHGMSAYEVPEYEHYRVARLIPAVERFVPITEEMCREAVPLLADGRSLLHVFVSAPHLFDVRDSPELSVRFILDPCYVPSVTCSSEEIQRRLDEINESRMRNGVRYPIDRKKRRALARQLQYITNPLPFLDEDVMAHALFDLLPIDGPVIASKLQNMLPRETLNCMPVNLTRFYRKYGHLFRVLDGDNEPVIQRSDLPIPEQRSLSDIGSEEILVLLYNNFPRRRHPKFGTCMERCINGLPRCARLRLRELDLVNDVLRQHPDKVELCGEQDADLTKVGVVESHPGWLQVFRFVGGYQEELIRRYEALCLKHGQDPNTTTKIG